MPASYETELSVAIAAVRQASEVCRSVQSQITPETLEKRDKSPVTVADFAAQAIINKALSRSFPNDPIVGEEDAAELRGESSALLKPIARYLTEVGLEMSEDEICDAIDLGDHLGGSERFWTLDPIDGTKGFLRKEQYAISLALIENGQIVLGILGCPNLPESGVSQSTSGSLLYAIRGRGAFQCGIAEDSAKMIASSRNDDFSSARLCESVESGHSKHDAAADVRKQLGIAEESVRLDSQAKYAVVARGDAEAYLRLPTRADYPEKIWDHAGGVIIVEEAGGVVTDCHGAALDFSRGRTLADNSGVIASSGVEHDRIVTAVQSALG